MGSNCCYDHLKKGRNFVFGYILLFFCVPTIIMGRKFVFACFNFFVFHLKSGTTNNHPTGSSDISY